MTRINLVPPSELHQKHLVAEYRELPRVVPLARAAYRRGMSLTDRRIPLTYTLGTGHCLFFYPRLLFLQRRHQALVAEMLRRGYSPLHTEPLAIFDMPAAWCRDYLPSSEALRLSRERIANRTNPSWSSFPSSDPTPGSPTA